VRKGNESLLQGNPNINEVIVWDKKYSKYGNLFGAIKKIRSVHYDYLFNLHRFFSSSLVTVMSAAKTQVGFKKNPMSFLFDQSVKHSITSSVIKPGKANDNFEHEIERNHELIAEITDAEPAMPKLYPGEKEEEAVKKHKTGDYVCIAPASVWFTKQYPQDKWIELIEKLNTSVYLVGGAEDKSLCNSIVEQVGEKKAQNLAGKLSLLETAALMKDAKMNYVNDSAPLHLASAVNAPVTAIFCSTVPEFGFGPLSENSRIVQTEKELDCRPCGIHGYTKCPKEHFECAHSITTDQLIDVNV